jgi:hypothetical protein
MSGAAAALTKSLRRHAERLSQGPLAIILIEDDRLIEETLDHHLNLSFRQLLVLSSVPLSLPPRFAGRVIHLDWDCRQPDAHVEAVNCVIRALRPATWLYYCYNTEFLFFPFSETRSIGELLAFHGEERRAAMLTYVIDLYAGDLAQSPDGVSMEDAMFDRAGYHAQVRTDAQGQALDRQRDFRGGLRWRFEEHIPPTRRNIDRIALFRTAPGLQMTRDHRFNIPEYNTHSCPWHRNLTAAIASFRVAKALRSNPGSSEAIETFRWRQSQPFEWQARQFMDLGLIEPGQWF